MVWFRNFKIRVKLVVCFLVIALLTAVVGVIGILNMNTINQNAERMYSNNYIPARQLSEVQKNLLLIRSNFLLIVYEKDVSLQQKRIDEINQWAEADSDLLEQYSLLISSGGEEKKLYDVLNTNLVPYRKIRADVLELARQGKLESAAEMIPEFAKAREAVDTSLEKLISYQSDSAQKISKENAQDYKNQSMVMIGAIILGILLALALGIIIAGMISKPITRLVGVANQIAEGDLDITIDINTEDETGILAGAFRKMAENINNVMVNISVAAGQVSSGAKQLSDSSIVLSQGATEQASSIEELSASIEEIASQTKQNAGNANEANSLTEAVRENADQGNERMQEMLKAMSEINDASGNIYKIIKVIDEIAFQTNILSLNAAVEAARAGQYGKGFAVVAEEVRNLAARSANAAKETAVMIEGSVKKAENGTKIANETAAALNKIVNGISKATNLIGSIAIASNEQASGIVQINQGILQVSQVVQTNSATSEESAAASQELASQAALLRMQVDKFKLRDRRSYKAENEGDHGSLGMFDRLDRRQNGEPNGLQFSSGSGADTVKIKLSDREFGKYN